MRRWTIGIALLAPVPALAHGGLPLRPHDLAAAWTTDPGIWLALFVSAWLYSRGVERLWRRCGVGGGIRRWEAACFAAGWLTLFLALASPVHALGDVLFSAHMAQHELLMALAAPLLVLGRPVIPLLWALPMAARRRIGGWARTPSVRGAWRGATGPLSAALLHGVAIWVWHLPGPYQATLDSWLMHTLQHASFLGTALLFWWAVLHVRRGYGAAVFALFATAMHTGGLGALLTFAARPWYPGYAAGTAAWGLTPLEDQQLAGLIMWVPGGIAYVAAALWLVAAWLRESERGAVRWQQRTLLRST